MKRCDVRTILMVGALLALAGPAVAQQDWLLGFGVGVKPDFGGQPEMAEAPGMRFYMPVQSTDRVMLEPAIALFRRDHSFRDWTGQTVDVRQVVLQAGIGLLVQTEVGLDGRVYVGPRLGAVRRFQDQAATQTVRQTDLTVAGVTGGEYFIADGLSVGGEIGLEYYHVGHVSGASGPDRERFIHTLTELRVRWYVY